MLFTPNENDRDQNTREWEGQANQANQINQANQANQTNQANQANPAGQPYQGYRAGQNEQPGQGYQGYSYTAGGWQQPHPAYWQGSSYHSGPAQQPGAGAPQQPQKPKKRGRAGKIALSAVCGVLACCVISAGSIAGFVGLVNSGKIQLSVSGGQPAFTIAQVQDGGASEVTVDGSLTLEEIAEKVTPSVVCVQNYQVPNQLGFQGTAAGDSYVSPAGEGSGIIMSEDGYIITNAHVVEGATSLAVVTSDGLRYEAELVGSDELTDLALLKVDAEGLVPAEFGDSDSLSVLDQVVAIGNPGGMEFNSSATVGYVSALNREVYDEETGTSMKYIQTDAAINPGNSGGALVNQYGQVVGINSAKIVDTSYEGIGFAIPINTAQPVISDLKAYGYVTNRPMLGVSGQFVDALVSRFYGLPVGMYIDSVTNDSITAAGVQSGDVITEIDGQDVTSANTISAAVRQKSVGDTVELTIVRPSTGATFTATVTLVESSS